MGTIPLTVKSLVGPVSAAPVFTGIPFPPGACRDVSLIELLAPEPAPRQMKLLSSYPDGSVRVALLGWKVTLAAGQTITASVRYDQSAGIALSPPLPWSRHAAVLALCPPRWYGESTVFGRFLASADNTLFPAFEPMMRSCYTRTSDPPTDINPDNRNYYDHAHALAMTLLRGGGPDSAQRRAWDEVNLYRENEILHTGSYRGQYQAGSIQSHASPIPFNVVRRMYPQGLLDDYYLTGDERSLAVAKEIGEAFVVDAGRQGQAFTYTERTPGFELIGLCALHEATGDARYLTAAKTVANIELNHQDAMAKKYPNQGGVTGQTGAFVQDRYGRWYDEEESTASGAGSPFMTTVLCDGLIRLYWLTGDDRVRWGILRAADWLADAAFTYGSDACYYICRDPKDATTTPSLNPMFIQMLGFAHQSTGEAKYLAIAKRMLVVNDWGNHIKEFNQGMHSSGQGLALLQAAPGTIPLTLGEAPEPPEPPPVGKLSVEVSAQQETHDTSFEGAAWMGEDRPLPAGSTITVIARTPDGATAQATATVAGEEPEPPPADEVIYVEAEQAFLTAPMVVRGAVGAVEDCIVTDTRDKGSAVWTLTIPKTGTWYVWARVQAKDGDHDSFWVSADGGIRDVFDAGEEVWTPNWRWVVLNGRGATGKPLAVKPRTFNWTAGTHTLRFDGREPGCLLDRLALTTDAEFRPG
jgi:hypothetical protein